MCRGTGSRSRKAEQQRGIQLESQRSQPVSNVLVIDALAAAAPPNHSTAVTVLRRKPIQDSRLDLTRARFAFEFVTFGKVPKSAIIDYRLSLTSKSTHGPSTRRYHPQRLCGAGNMYTFYSNRPGDPRTEKCGLPLFERRKVLINGQNPRHGLPRLQGC